MPFARRTPLRLRSTRSDEEEPTRFDPLNSAQAISLERRVRMRGVFSLGRHTRPPSHPAGSPRPTMRLRKRRDMRQRCAPLGIQKNIPKDWENLLDLSCFGSNRMAHVCYRKTTFHSPQRR
jgi:hypothetical protein